MVGGTGIEPTVKSRDSNALADLAGIEVEESSKRSPDKPRVSENVSSTVTRVTELRAEASHESDRVAMIVEVLRAAADQDPRALAMAIRVLTKIAEEEIAAMPALTSQSGRNEA